MPAPNEQVGLTGAGIAEQHGGLAPVGPGARGERGDGGVADRASAGVELDEVFEAGGRASTTLRTRRRS
jgi:hypothetical protein